MKNVMKKIGWFVVSLLPVPLYFVVQLGCLVVIGVILTVMVIIKEPGLSSGPLDVLVANQFMNNIVLVLIICQLAAFLVFGIWYYFAWGKRKRPEGTEKPRAYHILLILALGVAAQFAISGLLYLVDIFAPEALQNYEELMEMAGLTEITALTMVATTIFAPLSEELACRGVIFRLAGKISPKFWVANIVQALAFGVLHGNLVQGAYAFVLGIILGMLYGKFQNIWLCMLLHASMNFSSILVEPFLSLFPEDIPESGVVAILVVIMVLATALGALCVGGIMKKRPAEV